MNRHEQMRLERAAIAYLDGALDAASAAAFREELVASPEARALFMSLETAWRALEHEAVAARAEDVAVDLRGAVLAALDGAALPADDPSLEHPTPDDIEAAVRELLLDPLEDVTRAEAEALRALSPAHARAMDLYEGLANDLRALEEARTEALPAVDLRDAVLTTVAGQHRQEAAGKAEPPTVVSFRRNRVHRSAPVPWGLVAAAAVLVVALATWWSAPSPAPEALDPVATPIEPAPVVPESPTIAAVPDSTDDPAATRAPLEDALSRVAQTLPEPAVRTPEAVPAFSPDLAAVSLEDVWTLQRNAVLDPSTRASVWAMARVPEEVAAHIAGDAASPPAARVGAAFALPPAEAQVALLAVRSDVAPTPSLVFAQGIATRAVAADPEVAVDPEVSAPSLAQIIAELRALDPDNALTYYWEAITRLQAGDIEGALALLDVAESMEAANAYALESARETEAALQAAGMSPVAAAAAAALSAGMSQYDFLTSIGQDLMDEAQRLHAFGDTTAAEQILSAAQRLGEQIEAGSAMSWEQLAGLDLQRAAIEALENFLISTDDLLALTNDAFGLVAGMESMASFFDAFNSFFLNAFDPDFLTELSQNILRSGDLAVLANPEMLLGIHAPQR